MTGLAAEELDARAGTPPARVERLVALGLLERRSDEAACDERDLHRVRCAEAIDAPSIVTVPRGVTGTLSP